VKNTIHAADIASTFAVNTSTVSARIGVK